MASAPKTAEEELRKETVHGKPPLLAIMTPPPLWRDSSYGMNQSILNDIMPNLVPQIAELAALPPPIDIFTALGGSSKWRSTYPTCGCERPSSAGEQGRLAAVTEKFSGNFSVLAATSMADGNDFARANLTFEAAVSRCGAAKDCVGFTFRQSGSMPAAAVPMYLKKCTGVEHAAGWWTWLKPPPPVPKMPEACALFCATGESCDPCHPDDDGYDRLASKVFEWIVAHHPAPHQLVPTPELFATRVLLNDGHTLPVVSLGT